jgi:hypothetical protein
MLTMAKEILIKFDYSGSEEFIFIHRIRNFGEDVYRLTLATRYASTSIDEIDRATSEIRLQAKSAKTGRMMGAINKLLKEHMLTEFASVFVDGRLAGPK